MEKLDIIREAQRLLPEEIKQGNFHMSGKSVSVKEYMETVLIDHIKENATPQYVAEVIKNKFASRITYGRTNEEKEAYILNFINGLDSYKETRHLGKGQFENVRERLLGLATQMDNDFLIPVGPFKKTLEEYYNRLLADETPMLTLADKQEICIDCTRYIEIEVLESQMEGYEGTVEEYITEYLPTIMPTVDTVDFNGTVVSLPETIEKIIISQKRILEEAERNKYGKPDFVGELVIQQDGKVVSDAPVKPLEELTSNEIATMTNIYSAGLTLTFDELSINMNRLMDVIRNISAKEDFDKIEKEVQGFKEALEGVDLDSYLVSKLEVINSMVEKKKIILTKKNNIMDEYEDHTYNVVNQIRNDAKNQSTNDATNLSIGRALALEMDLRNVGSTDFQTAANLRSVQDELRANAIKAGSVKTNENPAKAVLKSTIEVEYINNFERDVQEAINYGGAAHLEGAVLRLEKEYERILRILKDLRTQDKLSNEEYQYFKSQVATALKKLYASQYISNENKSLTAQLPVIEDDNLLGLTDDTEAVTMRV